MDEELRGKIMDALFKKYVTTDEAAFSRELYMSEGQMQCMLRQGMYIGSHGYDHYWQDYLSAEKQEEEIDRSLEFLQRIGSDTEDWAMCYPYGAYNQSLIDVLKRKGCKSAFATKVGIASIGRNNAFSLERLDTNDLPKNRNADFFK